MFWHGKHALFPNIIIIITGPWLAFDEDLRTELTSFGNFEKIGLSNLDNDHDNYDSLQMFIIMALIKNHHHQD